MYILVLVLADITPGAPRESLGLPLPLLGARAGSCAAGGAAGAGTRAGPAGAGSCAAGGAAGTGAGAGTGSGSARAGAAGAGSGAATSAPAPAGAGPAPGSAASTPRRRVARFRNAFAAFPGARCASASISAKAFMRCPGTAAAATTSLIGLPGGDAAAAAATTSLIGLLLESLLDCLLSGVAGPAGPAGAASATAT